MKLKEAVKIGEEKGIIDVRKCVDNILFNSDKYFNHTTQNVKYEMEELVSEEKKYLKGELKF